MYTAARGFRCVVTRTLFSKVFQGSLCVFNLGVKYDVDIIGDLTLCTFSEQFYRSIVECVFDISKRSQR